MRRMFGVAKAKEEAPRPTLQDAAAGMAARDDMLGQRIRKLDGELARLREEMQASRTEAGRNRLKQRAVKLLQQKRQFEAQRDQLMDQAFTVEQVAFTQQTIKDTQVTVSAMKDATKELKREFAKVELDEIEDLTEAMADLADLNSEMQDALAPQSDVPDDIDESELMAELDALEFEVAHTPAVAENAGAEPGVSLGLPSYLLPESAAPLPAVPDAEGSTIAQPEAAGHA